MDNRFQLKTSWTVENVLWISLSQDNVRDHQYFFYNTIDFFKKIMHINFYIEKSKNIIYIVPTLVLTRVCQPWMMYHPRLTYSSQHQCGHSIYYFFRFFNIKIYMHYLFKKIYSIMKETLVVFDIVLTRRYSENVFDRPWCIFNEKKNPQTYNCSLD